jgi:Tol biopolymer transport system component
MVVYGRIRDDGQPLSPDNAGVFVVKPDGTEKRVLGQGTRPSLSRDGTLVTYGWSDGLHVVDLASGMNSLLPGTSGGDYGPRWSPDGSKIAFVRTDDLNLYLINADGSGLRQLTAGREHELLLGWLPDGTGLAYAVPVSDGMQLLFLDLPTGLGRTGFTIDSKAADAAISPDGSFIAFTARVQGTMAYGLYLSRLDGTEARLIAQLDNWSISDPVWSPDGSWLAVSMTDSQEVDAPTIPAVMDLATCQAIPLAGIEGYVQGWSSTG